MKIEEVEKRGVEGSSNEKMRFLNLRSTFLL